MSVFANLFGYILKFLYDIVQNYGIAIILFSVLIKAVMIPLTLKQQKTLKKNEELQSEMKNLQFKYKNDPDKMNQELMELYKREGMSPFSGCLSSIIQIILLLSVFLLVSSPLTYMVKMDEDAIDTLVNIVEEQGEETTYQEIAVIQYVKTLDDTQENNEEETNTELSEEENTEEAEIDINEYKDQIDLNMNFLGIDLSQVPTQDLTNWKTLIIPILYVISSIISIKLSTSMTKNKKEKELITDTDDKEGKAKEEEELNPMESANKTMVWMMPILSISIAIIAPLGLALYWLMNNILMIIERIVFNKILNKEEEAKEDA